MSGLSRIKVQQQKAAARKAAEEKAAALQAAIQQALAKACWMADRFCLNYRALIGEGKRGYTLAMARVNAVNSLAAAANEIAARSYDLLRMADKFLAEREAETDGR